MPSEDGSSIVIDQATAAADAIVAKNLSPIGIAASVEGYRQVWARDSMITLLGAALSRRPEILSAFRVTLSTLAAYQDAFGQVPYLVDIDTQKPEFGSSDSNAWFVIGAAHYVAMSGDDAWAVDHEAALIKALSFCEGMDLRKSGLMESGERADWADLLANHGNVLFPNVLYARALAAGADLLSPINPGAADAMRARRDLVVSAIRAMFWARGPGEVDDQSHEQARALMSVTLRRWPYFLPWVDGFTFGERFDTPANLLAALTGVASAEQSGTILDYIEQVGVNRPYPARVLHPPILYGEPEWRDYYKVYNLNLPNQYHNGGIWPWVGGLYVTALVRAGRQGRAYAELVRLAKALRLGKEEWECNEWLHGVTGMPMGVKYQAWSAGMFLYARNAVETGEAPGLAL